MRSLIALIACFLSGSVFAAACYVQQTIYACSNSTGTTCTKQAVTVLVPDNYTALSACANVALAGTEYSQLAQSISQYSGLNSRVTNLENAVSVLQGSSSSYGTRITALENSDTSLVSRVNSLTDTVSQLSSSLSGVSGQLSETFDLTTALSATAFFFSVTLFFYGIARSAGAILEVIRRPLGRGV